MAEAPLKVGMVGCGGISHMYTDIYSGLHDLAQVVAVADLAPELARNRAEALTAAYKAEAAIECTNMVLERDGKPDKSSGGISMIVVIQ